MEAFTCGCRGLLVNVGVYGRVFDEQGCKHLRLLEFATTEVSRLARNIHIYRYVCSYMYKFM